MFKKIIVGLDGSDHSQNALRVACDLAGKYNSEIHLVHTSSLEGIVDAVAGFHAVMIPPSVQQVEDAAREIFDAGAAIAKECGQEIIKTYIERGNPGDNILACAKKIDADLIVTGRRGLGTISGILQGSTSQRINHLAHCPCLTVV